MWRNLRSATYAAKFYLPNTRLGTPLLAISSHQPTCNLVCKTNAAANAATAQRWAAHRRGRAGARRLARRAAS
eukprot:2180106-Pyramimonas_sp.AAC.1